MNFENCAASGCIDLPPTVVVLVAGDAFQGHRGEVVNAHSFCSGLALGCTKCVACNTAKPSYEPPGGELAHLGVSIC